MTRKHAPSVVRDFAKRVVDDPVWNLLRETGFKRRGTEDFIRWRDDCHTKVVASFEKARGVEEGYLSIQLSIGFKSLWESVSDCAVLKPILNEYRNMPVILSESLENLLTPKQGPALVTAESDIEILGQQISQNLEQCGLVWFDQLDTLEKVAKALEARINRGLMDTQLYCLAAILLMQGQREYARTILVDRLNKQNADAVKFRNTAYADSVLRTQDFLTWLNGK